MAQSLTMLQYWHDGALFSIVTFVMLVSAYGISLLSRAGSASEARRTPFELTRAFALAALIVAALVGPLTRWASLEANPPESAILPGTRCWDCNLRTGRSSTGAEPSRPVGSGCGSRVS